MKYKLSYLHGMPVHATDGKIGIINDFLFDLRSGRIVHIVINTTGHMFGKYVVVAPEVCIIDGNRHLPTSTKEDTDVSQLLITLRAAGTRDRPEHRYAVGHFI